MVIGRKKAQSLYLQAEDPDSIYAPKMIAQAPKIEPSLQTEPYFSLADDLLKTKIKVH